VALVGIREATEFVSEMPAQVRPHTHTSTHTRISFVRNAHARLRWTCPRTPVMGGATTSWFVARSPVHWITTVYSLYLLHPASNAEMCIPAAEKQGFFVLLPGA